MLLRYPIYIILYLIPVILVSLTVHELSHAYFSYRLGDPTPKDQGRITLNPLKHLDPLGTIMILISGFGWAKPVKVNPMYYDDRKKGTMIVSLAGPLSNVLIALMFSFPMAFIGTQYGNLTIEGVFKTNAPIFYSGAGFLIILFNLSRFFYIININLAVFNILPIPPLDGSKILYSVLPSEKYYGIIKYEQMIGIIFLFAILVFPNLLLSVMYPFVWIVETGIKNITFPVLKLIFGSW